VYIIIKNIKVNNEVVNETKTKNVVINETTKPEVLSEQDQMVLRKTPSMDLLKKSPYLLLRLLACMKPIPSLDNYPREKKLIESIIETVKMEEELNSEFISELGNSLSKLDSQGNLSSSASNSKSSISSLVSNSQSNMSSSDFKNNLSTLPTSVEEAATKKEEENSNGNNTITITNTTNNIVNNFIIVNNNNESSSSKSNNKEIVLSPNTEKISNILEGIILKTTDNNKKLNTSTSIMNDISIQSPNNLINSIILKNFESNNSYKVPHYVTTIVPNNNSSNNNDTMTTAASNETPNKTESIDISNNNNSSSKNNSDSVVSTTINNKKATTTTENTTINEMKNKKYLSLDLDMTKNASTGNRFDKKIEINTIKNPNIIQRVNMNFTMKKDSLINKKLEPRKTTDNGKYNIMYIIR